MKPFISRQILIITMAALALGILCFSETRVHAQEMNRYIVMFPSVGLAPGERLRLTLFNPDAEPLRAQAMIHQPSGVQVGLADGSVRFVNSGVSQSFDIDRTDIPLSGEGGTGRLQLRASFLIGTTEPGTIDRLAVAMETVSISDGTSNTVFFSEKIIHAPDIRGGNDLLLVGAASDALMGIVPGQTLRVTLFNPPSFDSETGAEKQTNPATGHVKVFDGSGNLLAQSQDMIIPPGNFRSFDFNRDALASPGERGTSRQQVRAKPFYDFSSKRLPPVLTSFEIVDTRTGKTEVLSGQQCLVFFLGGIPSN